jgi:predicted dehydrogenase
MIRFGVIGIEHRHIYHLIQGLLDAGATCAGYATTHSDKGVLDGVRSRFPGLKAVATPQALLDDASVQLIVTAGIPAERAQIAVNAMRHGKDVLTDKPGVTTFAQLAEVRETVRQTGRLFAICFSERHIVPSVGMAQRLVKEGALGEVFHTLGMGPHRLNAATRPAWFFDKANYGGILVDIASHQIDQFLVLTGSADAQITHAAWSHIGPATAQAPTRRVAISGWTGSRPMAFRPGATAGSSSRARRAPSRSGSTWTSKGEAVVTICSCATAAAPGTSIAARSR